MICLAPFSLTQETFAVIKTHTVAVLVGSLRRDSLNLKIAKAAMELAPTGLAFEVVEIRGLPLYNQDDDADSPDSWKAFRNKIKAFDAVLFVTPEHNRSVPAALKNALDVGSRPYGESVWSGKPGAVISGSPGGIGGFGANHHLRQSLVFLNVPTMAQPEAYIGGADKIIDDRGRVSNEGSRQFLQKFMQAFSHWVLANLKS